LAAGLNSRLWRVVQGFIDTLQTLPSFVYLIPVVMLFRVGDFTAMIAVVLYALAPAVRYTALGIRGIDPRLIEASRAMGTTANQRLTKVRLPLAVPEIMLGLNQDDHAGHLHAGDHRAGWNARPWPGSLHRAHQGRRGTRNRGRGSASPMLAMIADRIMTASAARMRRRLGLA
jgi:glycine betaine/proline transport system permease protein